MGITREQAKKLKELIRESETAYLYFDEHPECARQASKNVNDFIDSMMGTEKQAVPGAYVHKLVWKTIKCRSCSETCQACDMDHGLRVFNKVYWKWHDPEQTEATCRLCREQDEVAKREPSAG